MNGLNSNISSLFNSLSTNSSSSVSGSVDLASYAAIKNGSYGKLVKAYYSEGSKSTETAKASSASATSPAAKTKEQDTDRTGLTQLKKDANELKASTEALASEDLWKTKDGKSDMDKITGAVKDFVNDYNKVIEQSSKVSSKEVSQDVKFMTGMTGTFTKILQKAGVTVGTDGKMSVNEEALNKADTATIKSLFAGAGTYGSQIADKANSISKDADMSTSLYGSDATVSSVLSGVYNQFI